MEESRSFAKGDCARRLAVVATGWLMLLAALFLPALRPSSTQYNYRLAKVTDSADYVYLNENQPKLLEHLAPLEGCAAILPARRGSRLANLVLEDGVKVFDYQGPRLIQLLQSGGLLADIRSAGDYTWIFPVRRSAQGQRWLEARRVYEGADPFRVQEVAFPARGDTSLYIPLSPGGGQEETEKAEASVCLLLRAQVQEKGELFTVSLLYQEREGEVFITPYLPQTFLEQLPLQSGTRYRLQTFLEKTMSLAAQPEG